jgi:hypothetical protein
MKKRFVIILLLVLSIFMLTSCKKDDEPVVVKKDPFIPSQTKVIAENMQEETVFAVLDAEGNIVSLKVVAVLDNVEADNYYTINARTLGTNANLSENNPLVKEGNLIKIPVKNAKNKYYYELELDKTKYELPYKFKFTYYLGEEEKTLNEILGKAGTFKIKLEITPNEAVAKEIREQFVAQVQVPIDIDKAEVIDDDGAMTSVLAGSVRTIAYFGMPGSKSSYELTIKTDSFMRINATISLQAIDMSSIDLENIFANLNMFGEELSPEALKAMVILMLGGLAEGMSEFSFIHLLNTQIKGALQGVLENPMDFSGLDQLGVAIQNIAPPVASIADEELRGQILASYLAVTVAASEAFAPEIMTSIQECIVQVGTDVSRMESYDPKYQKIVATKTALEGLIPKIEALDISILEDVALIKNNIASMGSDYALYDNDVKEVFDNFHKLLNNIETLGTKIGVLIQKLAEYQAMMVANQDAFGSDPAVIAQVQTIINTISNEQGTGLINQLTGIASQIESSMPTTDDLTALGALFNKNPETGLTPLDMPLFAILEFSKEVNSVNVDTPMSAMTLLDGLSIAAQAKQAFASSASEEETIFYSFASLDVLQVKSLQFVITQK